MPLILINGNFRGNRLFVEWSFSLILPIGPVTLYIGNPTTIIPDNVLLTIVPIAGGAVIAVVIVIILRKRG